MFSSLRIRTRIIGGFVALIALVCVVVMPFMLRDMNTLIETAEKRELNGLYQQLLQKVDAEQRLAASLATFVANLPDVQASLISDNRTALQASLDKAFTVLKAEYALRQLQFHLPPATSYLRVHKPEKYGDNLSGFRQTVVNTNQQQKTVSGIEKGVAGLGIRGVVPVVIEGQHWGSVEFGFSLGQAFFDEFKRQTGVDVSLYTEKYGSLEPFATTYSGHTLFELDALNRALSGEAQMASRELNRQPVAVFANQLLDFTGAPIGVIEIAMDRGDYLSMLNLSMAHTLIMGGLFLVLGSLAAVAITRSIVKPLNEMHHAMDNIALGDGDLTRRLATKAITNLVI